MSLRWHSAPKTFIDTSRRKRPTWMLIALLIATEGLYAPFWLAFNWRELKRDDPSLRLNSLVHGATWCPLIFTGLWGLFPTVPAIVWPALSLAGVARVNAHFKALDRLNGEYKVIRPLVLLAAAGYAIANWEAGRELYTRHSVDIGHFLIVLIAVVLGAFVVVPGQRMFNAALDERHDFDVPPRTHPLEWLTVAVGLLVQLANFTFI